MMPRAIVLASASARRQALLQQLGVDFTVAVPAIDERVLPAELPEMYVQRIAQAKAAKVQADWQGNQPILAADTSVVLDGQIFGKPENLAHAQAMLQQLAGQSHQVLTAVVLYLGAQSWCALSQSTVTFAPLTPAEIDQYLQTGEWHDKAGGYAVQGKAAAFIPQIVGSYSGIMGLPLYETAQLLQQVNIR